MTNNIQEDIMKDAIRAYILAEKRLSIYKRATICLSVACVLLASFVLYMAVR